MNPDRAAQPSLSNKVVRLLVAMGLALAWHLALASHISITGPPPQLHLAVGSLGTTVDTVTFNVPPGSQGSGVPVAGDQPVVIEVAARRGGGPGGGATTVFLTVDSSTPLTNGSQTIPMSEISWTTTGVIFPGTFNGTAFQLLLLFFAPNGTTSQEDTLTFSYANTSFPVAGAYTGTVVYTATAL